MRRASRVPRRRHERVTAKSRGATRTARAEYRRQAAKKKDKKKSGRSRRRCCQQWRARVGAPTTAVSPHLAGDGHVVASAAAAAGAATTATHRSQGPRAGLGGGRGGGDLCDRGGWPPPQPPTLFARTTSIQAACVRTAHERKARGQKGVDCRSMPSARGSKPNRPVSAGSRCRKSDTPHLRTNCSRG